jgi:CheY-like chemotaxis protein
MNPTLMADGPECDEPIAAQTALVVDDTAVDRLMAGRMLHKLSGLRVLYAANGREALDVLRSERPAVVLTDLQMPHMDGLDLVEALRCKYPDIPVILMTGNGSEEIAVSALRAGAASYVPKRKLQCDLTYILPQVLNASRTERRRQRFLESLNFLEIRLSLENDPSLVPVFVAHVQEHVLRMGLADVNGRIRVGVALEEALLNGLYHGNLEVSSDLRQDGGNAFRDLAEQRRRQAPYAERRLHVHVRLESQTATFVIRDEGPGFDPSQLPDPTDPENMLRASGRGMLLIRTFMDDVRHNESGNQITMVKRRTVRPTA